MTRKSALLWLIMAAAMVLNGCIPPPTAEVTSTGGPSIGEAQAVAYNGPKARIAVKRFDDKSAKGYREIGDGMSEMLGTALFNSNRFIVLERQQLGDILEEQDLAKSGRIKAETAAPTGEVEGAELMVTGAITAFEPNASGIGGGIGLPGLPLGLGAGMKKAYIALDIRVIDTRTSRLVAATSVEGTATDVGGLAGIGIGGGATTMGLGLGGFSKTPMEKAIRLCLNKAVEFIASRTPANYYHFQQ